MRVLVVAVLSAGMLLAAAPSPAASGDRVAAITLLKKKGYIPVGSTWDPIFRLNVLIGRAATSADGYNQRAFFFLGRRYLGTDAAAPSSQLREVWRDDRTIALLYLLYRPRDALCCPTGGGAIVRFDWNGSRLVALDPIPPLRGPRHR